MNPYISLARIDNWPKNLLMPVGAGLAYILSNFSANVDLLKILYAFFGLCLVSSANYVLNEVKDIHTDRHHPIKRHRAAVRQKLQKNIIVAEYAFLLVTGMVLGFTAHQSIFIVLILYVIAAWMYNIPPLRIKDKAYADVLLEAANYPIRILLGWMCVFPELLPPFSIILTAWAIGAFTMSLKRVAEFRMFKNAKQAAAYRKSYAHYDRHTLTLSGFVYGMLTIFGVTVLMLKYKTELVLLIPILIGWMGLYFLMGLRQNLQIIYPERLIKNKAFLGLTVITILIAAVLFNVSVPLLHILNEPIIFTLR